ncbi:MAG: small subunit ribosomal protein S7 [archaeon GW2011_AR17]|nr:MAG: small subunit ribosomal protein S7 [archaeon GW2011_AR17]MBS3153791.1 30S ribosomal protein S7 [Candidatus Woesearchaeota archaeon]HIH15183.1 30S ribosomal protein S7 [Nanoarchaeota archaeon]HIH59449.1 30S ribosomal protein S7 [Nanoarchaeota archaeon]HII13847.1 30S ribosomal protein S7 [Nanoarchaeota archaeon]
MSDIKIFNRWDISGIRVSDPGLQDYINLKPIMIPRTGGRNVGTQFWKTKYNVVERLINKMMIPGHKGKKHKITSGHCGGKGTTAYIIVEKTFSLIEQKSKKNPVEVFVKALENAAPREEITTIEYGGARYPKAVECAPQRRVDYALRLMVQGAYAASFGKKKSIEEALSEEIIKAYNMDQGSVALSKKLELERQSDASR